MAEQEVKTRLITPNAILSYPHLVTPQPNSNGKPKFSAALVFLPGTDLSKLQLAALAKANEVYDGKGAALFKSGKLRSPFRSDWESKNYPEGSTFINARSEQRPGLILGDKSTVALERITEIFYPGAIVRASLTAFHFKRDGNVGISFGLNSLQFVKDGERLDSRIAAEDEFESIDLSEAPDELPEELGSMFG